jgi:hypothetical protein
MGLYMPVMGLLYLYLFSSYLEYIPVTTQSEERSSVAPLSPALLICLLLLAGIKAIDSQSTNNVQEMISD